MAHVDPNPADIQEKMAYTQARRHCTDYLAMLDQERPDIVVLCSRHPGDHLAQIRAAAERGCHVYCEKPLAANLRDADEIVAIAQRHGLHICVAHPARYDLAFLTMKRRIESGDIGTPLTAYVGTEGTLSMGFNDAATPVCNLRFSRSPQPPETRLPFSWIQR